MTDSEKAKLKRNEYYREYRKQNREKIKQYEERYWAKKFETKKENDPNGTTDRI